MDYELTENNILFSCNKELLQVNVIHHYLSKESYWAQNIPLSVVEASIKGSLCFGVYSEGKQIAYARVITDEATFGYLADVFVLESYRKKGISKALMKFIMNHPSLKKLRRFMLATKDAHMLYEQFGFKKLSTPDRFMEIKPFEVYSAN